MSTAATLPPLDQVVNPFSAEDNLSADFTPETPEIASETQPETNTEQPTPTEGDPPSEQDKATEKAPSRKDLAAQLEAANAQIAKLTEEGSTTSQKYKDAVTKQTELEEQVKARDTDFVKARTPVYDWKNDPEVFTPRREIFEHVTDAVVEMADETGKVFKESLGDILNDYGNARSQGDLALRDYRGKLVERFGEDGVKIFNAARFILPKHIAATEAHQKNSVNHFENTRSTYEKRRREAAEDFSRIGRWTQEQIKAAPDDPDAIISAALGGDEELLKALDVQTHKAAQFSVGLPPLPADASREQVMQYREAEKNHQNFTQSAYRKDIQVRALSAIVKKLLDERSVLMKRVGSASPANRAEITPEDTSKPKPKSTVPTGGSFTEIINPHR